jgi:hypothetical protein
MGMGMGIGVPFPEPLATRARDLSTGRQLEAKLEADSETLRHSEHAHLLSNIEKLTESHFPFWAVCSLSGSQPEIWSVSWNPRVHRIACRLFVVPLNPTFRRTSQAEGERAPGPSGPVHSGHIRPNMVARTLMFGHVFVRMRCLTDDLSSDTLSTSCTHSRQRQPLTCALGPDLLQADVWRIKNDLRNH